jgi:hypothetical protein
MANRATDAPGRMSGKPLIESDRVEGTTVHYLSGSSIGSIKRLMIDKMSGKVAYAVMSFDTFLQLGGKEDPVPWAKLDYDPELGEFRTYITEEQLEGAPAFSADENYDWNDRSREREVYTYWGVPF